MGEKYEDVRQKKLSLIIWHNFIGGVAWGLGITVGAGIILTIGTFLISKLDYVPIVGTFVLNIIEFVQKNGPNL